MNLKDTKLLFIYDGETTQTNTENFLEQKVTKLFTSTTFEIDHDILSQIQIILVKQIGSAQDIKYLTQELSQYNGAVQILIIDSEKKISEYKKLVGELIYAYLSLPLDKELFISSLNSAAKNFVAGSKKSIQHIEKEKKANSIITFIEFYKILQKRYKDKHDAFAICSVKVVNYDELSHKLSFIEAVECIEKLSGFILEDIKDEFVVYANRDNLLFCLTLSYDEAKLFTTNIQKKVSEADICSQIKMKTISSMVYVAQNENLEKCMQKIDKLQNEISAQDSEVFVATTYDHIENDNEKVIAMLYDLVNRDNSPQLISVTNFYKGLMINNPLISAEISSDGILTLSTQVLQCIAMDEEKSAILHIPFLPNDVLCKVESINTKRKIAKLSTFKILNTSFKQRKFSRLVPKNQISATLVAGKLTVLGIISDISINSISMIATNQLAESLQIGYIMSIRTNFMDYKKGVPITLKIDCKLMNVIKIDDNYKIVVELMSNDKQTNEIITNYLKVRKKELIQELQDRLKVA